MRCPNCGNDELKVLDSRAQPDSIKRRRSCILCSYRFTTFERIEKRYPMIRKKDGSLERFEPKKIRIGLENAFRKREMKAEKFSEILADIDSEISGQTVQELGTDQIGNLILEKIQKRAVNMVEKLKEVDLNSLLHRRQRGDMTQLWNHPYPPIPYYYTWDRFAEFCENMFKF